MTPLELLITTTEAIDLTELENKPEVVPLLGTEEQNTQITYTDDYVNKILATKHPPDKNIGDSILSNKITSTDNNSSTIAI